MTSTHWPIHKLCYLESSDIFLAATGPCIQSLSRGTGSLLSLWPRDDVEGTSDEDGDKHGPPSKRLKLDDSSQSSLGRPVSEASEADIEIVADGKERQKGERRRPKIPDTSAPNISHLIVTRSGKHAVAITVEDKAVRVFRVSKRGRLGQLSVRSMPKKSCALSLTADERTILTADKFGDVYAIPLLISESYQSNSETPRPEKSFKPSASELTVHSKRNLEALKQQQKQKQHKARKEGPDFEHKLLLGHVSLLTDLATAHAEIEGQRRHFILTSDRDEHIRVSRGIPQTHIIHTFCMGHTEFVSRLCVLPPTVAQNPHLVVAGNGEPSLRLYDWYTGKDMHHFDIREVLKSDIESVFQIQPAINRLVVSGLWVVQMILGTQQLHSVLMTLEGLPMLFNLDISGDGGGQWLEHLQTINLDGNVLDVVQLGQGGAVAVAIDNAHKPGSISELREDANSSSNSIQFLSIQATEARHNTSAIHLSIYEQQTDFELEKVVVDTFVEKRDGKDLTSKSKNIERQYSILGECIYGLENLRKHGNKAGEEDADDGRDEADGLEGATEIEG